MEKKRPRQLYLKMFRTYTAMVLCIVAALVLYFISATRGRLLENGREEAERISGEALAYTEGIRQIADYLHRDLYRSLSELEDLLQYFRLEPEEYQQYALGRYSASEELVYKGTFNFMNEAFEAYPRLEKIELISYETQQLTECRPEKIVYPGKDGKARLSQIRSLDYCEPGKLVYVKEIRETDTMEPAGCILFTFEAEKALERIRSSSPLAEMEVTFGESRVIFQKPEDADAALRIRDRHYFACSESSGEYQIHTFLDERQAAHLPWTTFLAILAVGAAAGVVGVFFVDYYAKRFTGRVDAILEAMNQIMEEVRKNYKEDMNLKTLAYKYHMNASYLGQIFQKEVGCSFTQYLSNTKNKIAKDLILNTNLKINDIAKEVGYPDTSYFYRKFKQCYGVSPASLRGMKKY